MLIRPEWASLLPIRARPAPGWWRLSVLVAPLLLVRPALPGRGVADNENARLIEGKTVRLAYEPAGARADRYGRTLAYLYLEPGGTFVNREIIAKGFGHAYTAYPFAFMEDFRQAERTAREKGLGLWGPDPAEVKPSAETTVWVTKTGKRYHRDDCRALAKSATAMPLAWIPTEGATANRIANSIA
jgi:micrococcal nuclease